MYKLHLLIKKLALKGKVPARISFFVLGILSTIWFLIRVIPKPSRVYYPCIKTASPFMSSFVMYILSITATAFSFKKYKQLLNSGRGIAAMCFLSLAIVTLFLTIGSEKISSLAGTRNINTTLEPANSPMGIGKGIFPGRVVWDFRRDAVNQSMNESGNWISDENAYQYQIDDMVSETIMKLAGKETEEEAWDALFRSFNKAKGRGDRGYSAGEKIMIKANCTGMGSFMTTTPHVMLAILDQLVSYAQVPQEMIYIGDPRGSYNEMCYNKLYGNFSEVNYIGLGGEYELVKGNTGAITYSDNGRLVKVKDFPDVTAVYSCYQDASYLINLPALKAHIGQGITVGAKNHFGSQCNSDALPLHDATDVSSETGTPGYYQYRAFVDLMGNRYLGGNTMLTLVDGLWSGRDWGGKPEKWEMAPFNNSYPSSIFASQDIVAIESVCYDFMMEQFEYARTPCTDDYMHQAADPANWPVDINYHIKSLGVHEHWNNPVDKQYSQNLGNSGGIHLVSIPSELVKGSDNVSNAISLNDELKSIRIFPNPVKAFANISFQTEQTNDLDLTLYDLKGNKIRSEKLVNNGGSIQTKIDLTGVLRGEYILNISSNKKPVYSTKLTVIN
jgi:hypothetical protein